MITDVLLDHSALVPVALLLVAPSCAGIGLLLGGGTLALGTRRSRS